MAVAHQRPSLLVRWLKCCPKCGSIFGLQRVNKSKKLSGVSCDYQCERCHEVVKDWNPSSAVKF